MSIIATGCSSSPTVLPFEQDKIDITAQRPVPKCEWPRLLQVEVDGVSYVAMRAEDIALQRKCQVSEQSNFDIAEANADSLDSAVGAFNALVDRAKLHGNYAQNELTRVDEDRDRKAREVLTYQGLLAIVLIVSAL